MCHQTGCCGDTWFVNEVFVRATNFTVWWTTIGYSSITGSGQIFVSLKYPKSRPSPSWGWNPFIARLPNTLRRGFINHILFWTLADLERKPGGFRDYYDNHRVHVSLKGDAPAAVAR